MTDLITGKKYRNTTHKKKILHVKISKTLSFVHSVVMVILEFTCSEHL